MIIKSAANGSYMFAHGVPYGLTYLRVESRHLLSKPPALGWVRILRVFGRVGKVFRASVEERA